MIKNRSFVVSGKSQLENGQKQVVCAKKLHSTRGQILGRNLNNELKLYLLVQFLTQELTVSTFWHLSCGLGLLHNHDGSATRRLLLTIAGCSDHIKMYTKLSPQNPPPGGVFVFLSIHVCINFFSPLYINTKNAQSANCAQSRFSRYRNGLGIFQSAQSTLFRKI